MLNRLKKIFFSKYTLKLFSKKMAPTDNRLKEIKLITLLGSDRVISNPFIGLLSDASSYNIKQPFSMVYGGVSWKELEPEEGNFDFKSFETKIRYAHWKEQGKKFVLRTYMDYPTNQKHMDIPQWLYDKIEEKGTWYNKNNLQGFAPDYDNKLLINYHRKLIKAFSERYREDSAITFIEIGSIGQWGEWHNSCSSSKEDFPLANVTDKYVKPYLEYMSNKSLLMRRPFQIAKDNKLGLFNDAFGDVFQTESYFLNWINNSYKDPNNGQINPAMKDYWKDSPSGGEFADFPGDKYITDETIDNTLAMLKNSHTSWLGPSHPGYEELSSEKQMNLNKLLNLMGYRYSITKSEYTDLTYPGENLKGQISITNSGIAPFYFNWPVQLSLTDCTNASLQDEKLNFNLKTFLPGDSVIPFDFRSKDNLPSGIYNLNLSILDDATLNPTVEFANAGCENSKFCTIGETTINMPFPSKCDDLKVKDFHNYIYYSDKKLSVNSIHNDGFDLSENNTFIYQDFMKSDNVQLDLGIGYSNSNVESYSILKYDGDKALELLTIKYVDDTNLHLCATASSTTTDECILTLPATISVKRSKDTLEISSFSDGMKKETYSYDWINTNDVFKMGLNIKFKPRNTSYTTEIDSFLISKLK